MAEMESSLLTFEDLKLIEEEGVPESVRADLVKLCSSDTLVLTMKGFAFYKEACARYGVTANLSTLHTVLDLLELEQRILQERAKKSTKELETAYLSGKISVQNRDWAQAFLYGSVKSLREASARKKEAADAGPNVVPCRFRKTSRG